jgi:hypothetical protein
MGKLIQHQVYLHLFLNDGVMSLRARITSRLKRGESKRFQLTREVSIDSTIAIAFGVVGTLLGIYGLFIAYKQLKMMHIASRRCEPLSAFTLPGTQLKDSRSPPPRRQRIATISCPP